MGIIGGFISAVGSAISSGISGLCSAIGAGTGLLSGGIASLAASIIGPVVTIPQISVILFAIQAVAEIVSAVAEKLGLKEHEEEPEELAMKAEQAEKKPDDFDSISEYIEYLRNEIEIDKNKIHELSDEERVKYNTVGTSLYIKAIEEKYGIKAPGEFWHTVKDMGLDGEQVKTYLDNFKEHGITNMEDMTNFIKNQPKKCESSPKEISNAIQDSLKEIYPDVSDDVIADKYVELFTRNNN